MKPSTSLGTTSKVGMAKPSLSVRPAGNIRCLLVRYGGWRSSVARKLYEVNSKGRCRVISQQRQAKTKQGSFGIAQGMHFAGPGFCQCLPHRCNRPPLTVTCRERLGARVPPRDVAQDGDVGVPITGGLMPGHGNAPQGQRGT